MVSAVRTVNRVAPVPLVPSVTVAGSLQSEMGCPADWDPACDASDLTFDTSDGLWKKTVTLPAGDYEWKVADQQQLGRQLRGRGRRGRVQYHPHLAAGGSS